MPGPPPAPAGGAARCDVLVVGGGVNGAGIARDLAGRGLGVRLVERDDLASHTSSASTKLIHGGLRYLEYREFGLVRKALQEREVLLRSAPHIIRPLRFVLPHDRAMRPAWLVRTGLFVYDHLARRTVLPGSSTLDLRAHPAGAPLQARYARGFAYSDGWVDDARLVALCAVDARERGAQVDTRTACVEARRGTDGWTATLQHADGRRSEVHARALVNAAGPWAGAFLREHARAAAGERLSAKGLRLVKGSHIVVPRCFDHDDAYLFQNDDRRILFAIPYEDAYTLIGTTDVDFDGAPAAARIDDDEIAYLCAQASRYFKRPVRPTDVVHSFAGVRPLLDDGSGSAAAVTRDYELEFDDVAAPLLSVWGGKITTFRKLAEEAADRVVRALGERRPAWTRDARLPGGDLGEWIGAPTRPDLDFARFVQALRARHAWLPPALALRLARAYGARVAQVIGPAQRLDDLGREVAPGLHEAELDHLWREEWACSADDVLWRRTKRGLHVDAAAAARVAAWLAARRGPQPDPAPDPRRTPACS